MEEYIDAIHKIANTEKLNDPDVFYGQEVSKLAVKKVLMAHKLFWDEFLRVESNKNCGG